MADTPTERQLHKHLSGFTIDDQVDTKPNGIIWMAGTQKWIDRLKVGERLAGFNHKASYQTLTELLQDKSLRNQYPESTIHAAEIKIKRKPGPISNAEGKIILGTAAYVGKIIQTRIVPEYTRNAFKQT